MSDDRREQSNAAVAEHDDDEGQSAETERAYDATPGGTLRGRNAVDLLVDVKREFVAALDRTPSPLAWDARPVVILRRSPRNRLAWLAGCRTQGKLRR